MEEGNKTVRLTEFSSGSGCGCKIAPEELDEILRDGRTGTSDPRLLIGNEHSDDASVIDIGNGQALVSTTDFFMPIVDDAFDFGRIAAVNALSDVYAMGGTPLTALAILGWPTELLGTKLAAEVLNGARSVCQGAGISLTGGHSIESKEPFFGLSVSGLIQHENIKSNTGAQPGDVLFLTKPIGTGMLATALKREMLEPEVIRQLTDSMVALNDIGVALSTVEGVHAMTDVTGFGLLGHLVEMCEGSGTAAQIEFDRVPVLAKDQVESLMAQFIMPNNTTRNFKAYKDKASSLSAKQLQLLCDPQTSGGLLISVAKSEEASISNLLSEKGLCSQSIGTMVEQGNSLVEVV